MRKSGALSMLDCGRRSPIPVVFRCEVDMKLRLFCAGVFGIVALVSASVSAQWPLYPATDTPRTSSGRVRLDAPAPRTPDGKPDLSGLWQTIRTGNGQVIVGTDLPPLLYSTGKWEGDTLVVEASGLRDDVWLDVNGAPLTSAGKMTERFRRLDYGTLEIEVTVDDPKAYTKPWTAVKIRQRRMPDDELIEFVCAENEKSTQRFTK